MQLDRTLPAGCASIFRGDTRMVAPQLMGSGRIDYLPELTMSTSAYACLKRPVVVRAVDFAAAAMRPALQDLLGKGMAPILLDTPIRMPVCLQASR